MRLALTTVAAVALVAAVLAVAGPASTRPAPCGQGAAGDDAIDELLAAAVEAFEGRRYAVADSLTIQARLLLEAAEPLDPARLAAAHVSQARARIAQRQLADSTAQRSAEYALELLAALAQPHDLLRASAHDVLALVRYEQNRSDLALDHAHRTLALRRRSLGDRHALVAEALYRLGTLHLTLGWTDSSLAVMREGLDLRRSLAIAGDRRLGDFHTEIAELLERRDDLDGARAELTRALRAYEEQLGPANTALTQGLQRFAAFEYRNGEVARAGDLLQRAIAIGLANPDFNSVSLAVLQTNLAVLLAELGDFAGSRRFVEPAVPVLAEHLGPQHRQTLWAEVVLANAAAAAGDTTAAARLYQNVCDHYETSAGLTTTAQYTHALAGLAELRQDADPAAALRLIAAAEAAERARPDGSAATISDLLALQVRLHAGLGQWDQLDLAAGRLADHLAQNGLGESRIEARALAELSWAAGRRGRPAEARQLALRGAQVARRQLVQSVRALSDRHALTLAGERAGPLAALLAHAGGAGSNAAAEAWDELIRWRGLVAAEIANRRPLPANGAQSALQPAHAAWVEAQQLLARELVRQAGRRDADAAARAIERRLAADEAEQRWAALAAEILPAPAFAEIGLADVRAALPPDAALVAFAAWTTGGSDHRLSAFVARRIGAVEMLDLGDPRAIAADLAAWRHEAGRRPAPDGASEQRCREAGWRLRASTWDLVAPALGDARAIYLVPEGPLHGLPWGALPDGDGYLVERPLRWHVLRAERDLAGAGGAPAGGELLAVGGVDFGASLQPATAGAPDLLAMTRWAPQECDDPSPSFAPLPGTRTEVEHIATVWPYGTRLLVGADAHEAAVKALAPGARVLHLATHALVAGACEPADDRSRGVGGLVPVEPAAPVAAPPPIGRDGATFSPWLGRRILIALAGADQALAGSGEQEDGLLTAEEIVTLDLRGVHWVVLSACASGVADTWHREGALGLLRAFHLAGARAVIASQWPVDDDATREWMSALYGARLGGVATAGEAVQEAARSILAARRAEGRSTHPFYWAAFTASGD